MSKEKALRPHTEILSGAMLKDEVRKHMIQRKIKYREEGSAYYPLTLGLLSNLDDIDMNWNIPRSRKEIKNSIGSFCAAFHYAHIRAGKEEDFVKLYDEPISGDEKWKNIIQNTMNNPDMKADFEANAWREPMTTFPDRGVTLQYILFHWFGGAPITGIDLGAGMHTTFPLLNSKRYKEFDFEGKDGVSEYAGDVNIELGVGIDFQARDKQWTRACVWPIKGGRERLSQFDALMDEVSAINESKFPLIQANITRPEALKLIREFLFTYGSNSTFDFVNGSFIRQFLGDEPEVQKNYEDFVKELLREGGIFIDSGRENLHSNDGSKGTSVDVYIKRGKKLVKVGTPFVLANQMYISSVDPSYFESSKLFC